MKKILLSLAGVAALSCTMNASAAVVNLPAATSTPVSTVQCTLLDEGVSINMSKDVGGSVDCDTGVNGIGVATCHVAGLKETNGEGSVWRVSSLGGSIGKTVDKACGTPTEAATATALQATAAAGTAVSGS